MSGPGQLGRGQTTIDFVIAVGIFLLTIAFVVSFMPQMTVPYEEQEKPLVAERTADTLVGSLLASNAPSTLDEQCTVAFFNQTGAPECPFDTSESLTHQLGLSTRYDVNATIMRDVTGDSRLEPLCGNDGSIEPCGASPLTIGPSVPDDERSVATTRRTIHVNGTDAVFEVTVW